jgi:hypothetical protein
VGQLGEQRRRIPPCGSTRISIDCGLPWQQLTGALEDYYASPIGVDGKVYIASEHGMVMRITPPTSILLLGSGPRDGGR